MPYIKPDDRKAYEVPIQCASHLVGRIDKDQRDGHINYMFSRILNECYDTKYSEFNAAIGVLESIKQEFYRRRVAPYEDTKIEENGDI